MNQWKTALAIICISCIASIDVSAWQGISAELAPVCYEDSDGDLYGNPNVLVTCTGEESDITNDLDCDDTNPLINPGATEDPYNNVDENCDGVIGKDDDGDGFISDQTAGDDCDDTNKSINPDATEIPDNGIDENCDGFDLIPNQCYADEDGDGWGDASMPYLSEELCSVTFGSDNDLDCNDTDASINPGATEDPYNNIDENCDGVTGKDDDGDGFISDQTAGDDCDDSDADIRPDVRWCEDSDNDGFGDPRISVLSCETPPQSVKECSDCDDSDASIMGSCDAFFESGFEGDPF